MQTKIVQGKGIPQQYDKKVTDKVILLLYWWEEEERERE